MRINCTNFGIKKLRMKHHVCAMKKNISATKPLLTFVIGENRLLKNLKSIRKYYIHNSKYHRSDKRLSLGQINGNL